MAKNEVATVSRYYVPNLGTGHYLSRGGKGRGNHGVGQAYFILEKRGGPKRFSRWLGVGHCHGVL